MPLLIYIIKPRARDDAQEQGKGSPVRDDLVWHGDAAPQQVCGRAWDFIPLHRVLYTAKSKKKTFEAVSFEARHGILAQTGAGRSRRGESAGLEIGGRSINYSSVKFNYNYA